MTLLGRASSHLANQVERPNPKLLFRGKDRSPLKYIISVLLSDSKYFIKKKFGLSTKVWVSVLGGPKLLLRGQTLGAKSAKKYCHIGTLEAFHLWSLATSEGPKVDLSALHQSYCWIAFTSQIDRPSVKTR